MNSPHEVATLLQDPANAGGTDTVNRWYQAWMDRHRPGSYVEHYLDETGIYGSFVGGLRHWRSQRRGPLPRLFPQLHVPQYLAGRALLARSLCADEVHVLGGVAIHGTMAPRPDRALVWIGTTIRDERAATTPHHTTARRWLHRLSLPTLAAAEEDFLRRSTRVLAQSPHTADVLLGIGVRSSRVEIVPVPVDTDAFGPMEGERHGLLFVGRTHDPRKNFAAVLRLLDASAAARHSGVDVVSAEGPADVGHREETIRRRGWVDDLPARYAAASILLLPSHQEGLAITAFEALACETPVVALRCGGPDHFLRESGGGLVADDERDFIRHVEALLADESMRTAMGRAGCQWVRRHMSAQAFLAQESTFRL